MDDQAARTEEVRTIAEDDMRSRILEISPQIRADVETMTRLIREMVDTERAKLGFDRPRGVIELTAVKTKSKPSEPDLTGHGRVAGRSYKAAAWLNDTDKLRIALLPSRSQ